jgi:hypothetical protein
MYENQIDILKTPNKDKSVNSDAGVYMYSRTFFKLILKKKKKLSLASNDAN